MADVNSTRVPSARQQLDLSTEDVITPINELSQRLPELDDSVVSPGSTPVKVLDFSPSATNIMSPGSSVHNPLTGQDRRHMDGVMMNGLYPFDLHSVSLFLLLRLSQKDCYVASEAANHALSVAGL